MTKLLLTYFCFINFIFFSQITSKKEYLNNLSSLKSKNLDNLKINDSLTIYAELVAKNLTTKDYSLCNILIPRDKYNEIEILFEYSNFGSLLRFTSQIIGKDTLSINYLYPIMIDTLGNFERKIVRQDYYIKKGNTLKKCSKIINYNLSSWSFNKWYENHIENALIIRNINDLNILFTIINSKEKQNDFFMFENARLVIKCFSVDYEMLKQLTDKYNNCR